MGIGPAAFWIAIAAIIISWGYFRSRREAARHETLRHIVEKTGQVDESLFRALFPPSPDSLWPPKPAPQGTGQRLLKVFGTLVICFAIGLGLFFSVLQFADTASAKQVVRGYASASLVLLVGIGLLLGSRFLPKPDA